MDQKYLGNVLKTALIFAVIGAALVYLVPAMATWLGLEAATAGFQALFFGCFGAMSALITPIVDKLFAKPSATPPMTPVHSHGITKEIPAHSHAISSPTPDVYLNSEPPLAMVENAAPTKSFVDSELARRNNMATPFPKIINTQKR